MNNSRKAAWAFVAVTTLGVLYYLIWSSTPPADPSDKYQFQKFGQIPVLDHGRVKPIDTLARVSLFVISGRQTYRDAEKNQHSAVEWLLDVMTCQFRPPTEKEGDKLIRGQSAQVKAYRLENSELRALLGVDGPPDALYSFAELFEEDNGKRWKKLAKAIPSVTRKPREERSATDRALLDLAAQAAQHKNYARYETTHKVFRIDNDQVRDLLGLAPREGYRYGFDEFVPRIEQLINEADRADNLEAKQQSVYDVKVLQLGHHVRLYAGLASSNANTLKMVPLGKGEWESLPVVMQAIKDKSVDSELFPAAMVWAHLQKAYAEGDVKRFNRGVEIYTKYLGEKMPEDVEMASTETGFNAFDPFYQCQILYMLVFLIACVSWLWRDKAITRYALCLGIGILLLHTWAICVRMYLQGRPPVTNLYSSAVFIGWMCVLASLVVEGIFRNGFAAAVGGFLGFATLQIGNKFLVSGDTLEMMQAVLDTNFWLATHVTCVTIGYAATFVAGAFGIGYVLCGVITALIQRFGGAVDLLSREVVKTLGTIIYGVVCFAMLFSFVGTILGGIWADYSWGRFWGWDPKENGAVLIVIMNALILHARWGGMVKERGMAVLAMTGSLITMWSWFGTNQLQIGLHSYGFNKELIALCRYFWLSQLGLIALGLLPLKVWYAHLSTPAKPPAPSPADPAKPTRPAKAGRKGSTQLQPKFS
jgi:ABC-type transport system involved in cytochrome c biogenesis permease subunit